MYQNIVTQNQLIHAKEIFIIMEMLDFVKSSTNLIQHFITFDRIGHVWFRSDFTHAFHGTL